MRLFEAMPRGGASAPLIGRYASRAGLQEAEYPGAAGVKRGEATDLPLDEKLR